MNLNTRYLKLTGQAELPSDLEIGKNYALGGEVSITDEKKRTNEDGTYDLEYKARLVRAAVDTATGRVYTKDKKHQSAKTRFAIIANKHNYKPEMDDEDFYNLIQQGIRSRLPEIINLILKA